MARRKRRNVTTTVDVPEHLRHPVIELDPEALESERMYQAYAAWREYTSELIAWRQIHAPDVDTVELQRSLGTTFADFHWIAENLPAEDAAVSPNRA